LGKKRWTRPLRVYVLSRGPLAEKVVNNLVRHGFADMIVGIHEYPEQTHGLVDDLETVMPPDPPQCDLLLALFLHPDVAVVIPEVAKRTGAREVLVPIDDWHLMPEGLRRQIQAELDEHGIKNEFPRPFCQIGSSKHPLISEFAQKLGRPEFEIEERGGVISGVRTKRDTPCGSACFVAEKLVGVDLAKSREKASRAHLDYYPCLAGMDRDPVLKTEIMQVATEYLCEEVAKAIEGKGGRN
jgi:hypothetical protein